MNVSEYWMISAPGERTCSETWDRLNQVSFKKNCSTLVKIQLEIQKLGKLQF